MPVTEYTEHGVWHQPLAVTLYKLLEIIGIYRKLAILGKKFPCEFCFPLCCALVVHLFEGVKFRGHIVVVLLAYWVVQPS